MTPQGVELTWEALCDIGDERQLVHDCERRAPWTGSRYIIEQVYNCANGLRQRDVRFDNHYACVRAKVEHSPLDFNSFDRCHVFHLLGPNGEYTGPDVEITIALYKHSKPKTSGDYLPKWTCTINTNFQLIAGRARQYHSPSFHQTDDALWLLEWKYGVNLFPRDPIISLAKLMWGKIRTAERARPWVRFWLEEYCKNGCAPGGKLRHKDFLALEEILSQINL